MCGPTTSLFYSGLGIFGAFFLGLLAILIHANYPYAGEWFESKPATAGAEVEPLDEQREHAVHNLWAAAGVYGAIAVLSGLVAVVHKLRGNL